jgi:prophage DNA circulation protein
MSYLNSFDREEATDVIYAVVTELTKALKASPDRSGSLYRLQAGDLMAHAEQYIEDAAIAAPMVNLFNQARFAGATLDQIDYVRQQTELIKVKTFIGRSTKNLCVRLELVACARILTATVFRSRQQVDGLIDRMNVAFEQAEITAGDSHDQANYQAIIKLHAAVTFDLATRERPLPSIVSYTFPRSQPSLWITNRLYGGAERNNEIVQENRPVHPAFMQMPVRALSQ